VGSGYENLKKRYARMEERIKNGASKANFSEDEEPEVEKLDPEEETKGRERASSGDYEKKRKKKTKEDIEREALEKGDLYGVLGLEKLTYEAGDSDIRRAYQKFALKYHPDKLGDKVTEKDKDMWLKIQDAYETLSDPTRRRRYDSSLPFNDTIPNEKDISDANFFEEFSAVFNRNAMWAKKKPTPNLGDLNTPIAEVKKFYKYWDNFESWREFSQYDEYDLNDA
jgi:DnaJ family protein C protein 2